MLMWVTWWDCTDAPPICTDLSVVDEGRHGGQAGLDALMPRQHVLLVAVQEFVQDPAGTKNQSDELYTASSSSSWSKVICWSVPEDGKLDSPVSSVLLHQTDQILIRVPTVSHLIKQQ